MAGSALLAGVLNLGGGEIILVLALVLILFGARKLPEMARGLGRGLGAFRDAADDLASDAGRSAGGVYGKRAAQALTPDNQVAELYDPGAFEKAPSRKPRGVLAFCLRLWSRVAGLAVRAVLAAR